MHWQKVNAVTAHAAKFITHRADSTCITFNITESIKQSIQMIADMVVAGVLEPCPRCEKNGVPRGYYRGMDAAGDSDDMECDLCHGWTVIEVKRD